MHNQVGPQGWLPKNIEIFHRLGSLAEGILYALPAAGITIMAYGKITKV